LIAIGAVITGLLFCGWGMMRGNNMMMGGYQKGAHQMNDGRVMDNNKIDMHTTMDGMAASLEGKTGDTFDKAFIDEMIVHHEGAVAMAEMVLEKSKRPELLKLASDIISAQTSEIQTMKTWRSTWFK
jgi:uncharacterized protein (DUF305 family)